VALSLHDYVTAHIGKYLNGYEHEPFRNIPPGWSNWHGLLRTYRMYGYVLNENGTPQTYGHLHEETKRLYQTNVLRRIATRFIRGRAHEDRPFYLSVAFLAPHAEVFDGVSHAVRPDPDDVSAFASKPLPRGPAFDEEDMSDKPPWLRRQLTHHLTAPQIAAITRRFHARQESLLAVDRAVEAIVDTLRDTGQLRGTYVIFTSDNGFMEGQHRIQAGKIVSYEPATALPLLVRGPGIPAGRVAREPVIDVDLAPTILDMTDTRHSGWTIDGRSLLPFVRDPGLPGRRDILLEGPPKGSLDSTPRFTGLRTHRYVYVEYRDGERELYDLRRDPFELRNRAADPASAPLLSRLARRLARLRGCAGAGCRR
jgi:arylsulfatase A-like enzyme